MSLKDYLVPACDKLLECTCNSFIVYMKSNLLSKFYVLAIWFSAYSLTVNDYFLGLFGMHIYHEQLADFALSDLTNI